MSVWHSIGSRRVNPQPTSSVAIETTDHAQLLHPKDVKMAERNASFIITASTQMANLWQWVLHEAEKGCNKTALNATLRSMFICMLSWFITCLLLFRTSPYLISDQKEIVTQNPFFCIQVFAGCIEDTAYDANGYNWAIWCQSVVGFFSIKQL